MQTWVVVGVALAAPLVGCRTPTEVRVEITTDEPCSAWRGAALAVGELGSALEGALPATSTMSCSDAGYLGAVVVIPSGSDTADVAFKAIGAVDTPLEGCTVDAGYSGCIVARRALRFIPHESLTLAVPLLRDCKDVPCGEDQTCVNGGCQSATIPNPGACERTTCSLAPVGDGGAVDATVSNGGGELDGAADDANSGDGATDGAVLPAVDAAGLDASGLGCGQSCAISAGQKFSCVVRSGGALCWGEDDLGETGNGGARSVALPGLVAAASGGALDGVRGLVSGEDTSCAFLADSGASCWGAGAPLGVATGQDVATPAAFLAGAPLATIGNFHMCFEEGSGGLVCQCNSTCDDNSENDAYNGNTSGVPAQVPLSEGPVGGPLLQLESSTYFTCVLVAGGSVYCLGRNDVGEVDPTGSSLITTFTLRSDLTAPVAEIRLRGAGGCARTAGHVRCWGNSGGAKGNATEIVYSDGGALGTAVGLTAGSDFNCATLRDGHVACWGGNESHQLGRGESTTTAGTSSSTAEWVLDGVGGSLTGVSAAAAGQLHVCALKVDGTTWCWGDNANGQLGQDGGAPATSSVPLRVAY